MLRRNIIPRHLEKKEKDFAQIILERSLSTVLVPYEAAVSAPPLSFNSSLPLDYYDQVLALIPEEALVSIAQGLDKGNPAFDSVVNDSVMIRDGLSRLTFNGEIPRDQEHTPTANVLLLRHLTSGVEVLALASESFKPSIIEAQCILDASIIKSNPTIFEDGENWQLTYITSLANHQRLYEACMKRTPLDCLRDLAFGSAPELSHVDDVELAKFTVGLNPSQQRAVQSAIQRSEGVTLIQGPPGAGKTKVLTSILAASAFGKKTILACAPSNKAIQGLAERFSREHPDIPVILVGIEGKVPDTLRPILLNTWGAERVKLLNKITLKAEEAIDKEKFALALNKAQIAIDVAESRIINYFPGMKHSYFFELRSCLAQLCQQVDAPNFSQDIVIGLLSSFASWKTGLVNFFSRGFALENELIECSVITFSTLSATGRAQLLKRRERSFDVFVVDEAAQSAAELFIALQYRPRAMVLVGDPQQLSATVLSPLAKEKGFGCSLMEMLVRIGVRVNLLDTQYRMHEEISRFPSSRYYAGRLMTHASVSAHTNTGILSPIAFYDISSGRESSNDASRQNDQEAHYTVRAILQARNAGGLGRIGVITPCSAQAQRIVALLQLESPEIIGDVTVKTVDGFQGEECEIIIISCVCTYGTIGFLSDSNRLNVALTRAKETLIILGNAAMLESCESDWKVMIANLRDRGKFFTEQQLLALVGNDIKKSVSYPSLVSQNPSSFHKSVSYGDVARVTSAVAVGSSSEANRRAATGKKPTPSCVFFERGNCKNGDSCRFVHKYSA